MKIWFPAVRAGSGSDVFVQRLVNGLRRRGVEASITWLPQIAELFPALARLSPPRGTTVIHVNSWHAGPYARFGLPLVVTLHHCVHDPLYRDAYRLAQRLYHRLIVRRREADALKRAAAAVTVSDASRRSIGSVFGVQDINVIPVFVNTDVFFPPPNVSRSKRFRLLFVGNRSRRKGADRLFNVMRLLGGEFELRIAAGLRAASQDWHLPGNVRLLPPAASEHDMARYYQDSDALLLLSRQEGFSYAALEAMACGRPVIAFDSPAIREVTAGASLLAPQGDFARLVEAARRLMDDRALYSELSARGRVLALETYGETPVIDRYIELYGRLTERPVRNNGWR